MQLVVGENSTTFDSSVRTALPKHIEHAVLLASILCHLMWGILSYNIIL